MNWKDDYTIRFNLLESIRNYYAMVHKKQPSDTLREYWNGLDYDTLEKVKMLYRARWMKTLGCKFENFYPQA